MDTENSLGAPLLDESQRDSMSLVTDEDAEIKQYYKDMKDKNEKRNYWFMIIGTGTLKMTWETLHVAIVTFYLQRFYLIVYLSILLIAYGFAQSFGSVLAGQLVKKYRANRVLAVFMAIVAVDVGVILVIEAGTSGTFTEDGIWDPVIMFPLAIVMGVCEGATELSRRVISPLIVSGNEEQLEKLNSAIHIAWGLFGAIGAFTSKPMVEALGYVFAMIHIPVVLGIGITFILLVRHEPPKNTKGKVIYYTARENCIASMMGFRNGAKEYFTMIKTGGQIIFTKGYWWIVVCYTLPQIIYYLLESVFFSVYANDVLLDYSLPGIFLGSANVGEMIGAIFHLTLGPRVKEFFWWTRGYAFFLNIFWFFPFIYTDTPLTFALAMIPPIACLNAGWSSSDISILSYIQSSFPEDEENPDNNKLPAVIGFLYTLFSLTAAVLSFAIGEVLDVFLVQNRLREGFIYLPATWLSAMSVLIMIVTFTAKRPAPIKEMHH